MINGNGHLFVFILWFISASSSSPSCRDLDGKPVDWFIALKLPKSLQFYVMTASAPKWQMSKCNLHSKCGPIYDTIQQVYNRKSDNSSISIIYNGQKPTGGHSSTYGHMKGVISFEAHGNGFWLIHSVPKFPGKYSYNYPKSGKRYAQHFFCVNFKYPQLPHIVHQLIIARPDVYSHHIPEWLGRLNSGVYNLVNRKRPKSKDTSRSQALTSSGGASLKHFSQSKKFGKDLFGDLVAPSLGNGFFMEGWVNGRGSLPSFCSGKYPVFRIRRVQLMGEEWKTTRDHSKWAVSDREESPWVCLGDLNRQKSQYRRGGGTLCMNNKIAWKAFRQLVKDYDSC